jgi:polyribonucleotide nucleotidyltransferase
MRRCVPALESGIVKRRRTKMTVKKLLKESIRVGDRDLTVEVGRVAKQADGSCIIRYGDTMV